MHVCDLPYIPTLLTLTVYNIYVECVAIVDEFSSNDKDIMCKVVEWPWWGRCG